MDKFVALDETLNNEIVFPNFSDNETEYYYENLEYFFLFNFTTRVEYEYIHGIYLHLLEEVRKISRNPLD